METQTQEEENYFGEVISSYTSKDAEEDGYLINIDKMGKCFEGKLFNYITDNLFNMGYVDEKTKEVKRACILDLLNQAWFIVHKQTNGFKNFDTFFSGKIQLPNGKQQEIFIQQNETGRFTIMLPQDN